MVWLFMGIKFMWILLGFLSMEIYMHGVYDIIFAAPGF